MMEDAGILKVYAVRHKEENVRRASRSGGIFTALSDFVLRNNGVIYGCVLTEKFRAVHIRADNENLRNLMRGSKYIESNLGGTYRNVKKDLDGGRTVLFSGTSCQVAGLFNFLGREYEELICVDIVCHGVPSSDVWIKYLKWQEERTGRNVKSADFRNKADYGWREHIETLSMYDNSKVSSKVFSNLFYGHLILRPSCYECPYKDVIHPGDITIADYWGIEKAAQEFDDNKGVSLVLVNTDKGNIIFEECKSDIIWKETKIEDSMQGPLKKPCVRPMSRDNFWKDYKEKSFHTIAVNYGRYGFYGKIVGRLKRKKC